MTVKFDADRLKVQLKMAVARLNTIQLKHRNMTGGRRKEIADALKLGNEDRARVLTRYLIRDDYTSEAYEMLLIMCDDLIRSVSLIAQEKTLDPFLEPAIKTLIWAGPRIEVPELLRVKEQLIARYGRLVDPIDQAQVDPRIVVKLAIRSPDPQLIDRYLAAIAQSFGVDWSPPEPSVPTQAQGSPSSTSSLIDMVDQTPPPDYSSVYPTLTTAQPQAPVRKPSDSSSPPPPPPPPPPSLDFPSVPRTTATSPPPPSNDFEELTRRFEALKQSKK